ncbi:tail fiber domain-containing protein [Candidatus Gracilibacteria bacterium]|nr:tail fiber domain-containing protein [Candidatus Gracilibacteria bacterium]
MYNKIFASMVLVALLSSTTLLANDEQLFDESRTRVLQLQQTDPTLPAGVDSKGVIGGILSRMFHSDGTIRPRFLGIFNPTTGGIDDTFIPDISADKITSGVFDADRIPNLDTSKITSGNFDFNRISNVSITNSHIANNAAITGSKISPNFGSQNIITTGNTGLGNTSPNYRLDVTGDINFSGQLRQGGTPIDFAGKWQDSSTAGQIYYNAGNVGIGTTSPTQKLDVVGNIRTTEGIIFGNARIQTRGLGLSIGANAGEPGVGGNNGISIGRNAGEGNTSPYYQVAIGIDTGVNNTGNYVTQVGHNAGRNNTGTQSNVFGAWAGQDNVGLSQSAFGHQAGRYNTGNNQSAFGVSAGINNTGSHQSAFGAAAGQANTGAFQSAFGRFAGNYNTGNNQSVFGYYAGQANTGAFQSAFGRFAGFNNTGDHVIGIGFEATHGNQGDNVIGIGHRAGRDNTLANQFIVRQSNVNSMPLIQGDFQTGNVGIGNTSPNYRLDVTGDINFSGQLRQGGTPIDFAGKWQDSSTAGRIYYNAGNVGIGTDNPTQRLDVAGNIRTTGVMNFAGSSDVIIQKGGTDIINIKHGGTDFIGIGVNAGAGSTGNFQNLFGELAGSYSSGDSRNALGKWAGRNSTGSHRNTFGWLAGFNNSGNHQNALGNQAGDSNSRDHQNALGNWAGRNNSGESQNALGERAGYNNTGNHQNALGRWAGDSNSGEHQNAFGYFAGAANSGEAQNAFGDAAGTDNSGNFQNALGKWAGRNNSGDSQIAIGVLAGFNNTGDFVTGIGHDATGGNTAHNVIGIGHRAGFNNTLANQFIVRQSNVNSTPLIQGDFQTGNLGIGTTMPTEKLDVAGNVRANSYLTASDEILKDNIVIYTDGKAIISGIEAKRYNWKDSGKEDIGLIAQDVQKVFPEAVSEGSDGILAVDYVKLIVPLLQVTQEQQKEIELLKEEIQNLKK